MATRERSTKEVVGDARSHLRELVDAHVALAKAEMAETQQQLFVRAVPGIVGGVLALYVTGFFAVAAVKGLDNYVTEGWAWLIVSGGVTLVAILLALLSRRLLRRYERPAEAQQSIHETVEWARNRTGRNS